MNTLVGSIRSAIPVIAVLAVGFPPGFSPAAAADPDSQLRWKPHRASMTPPTEEPVTFAEEAATPSDSVAGGDAVADSLPSGPPASVSLPDGVPLIEPTAPRLPVAAAVRPRRPSPPPPAGPRA